MNLREERNRQKLTELLDTLGLSKGNRALAEAYLLEEQMSDRKLPENAEPQDFSGLSIEIRRKSRDYLNDLLYRNRKEQLARYLQLTAAIGGSTAIYLYREYEWQYSHIPLDTLSLVQQAAIYAEHAVWDSGTYLSNKNKQEIQALLDIGSRQPEALLQAQQLCFHQRKQVRILLMAAYLFCVRDQADQKETMEEVHKLEEALIHSVSELFRNVGASPADQEQMTVFLRTAEAGTEIPRSIQTLIRKHGFAKHILRGLSESAFLAMEASALSWNVLLLFVLMDMETVLESCRDISPPGSQWFSRQLQELEDTIPVTWKEEYLQWALRHKQFNTLQRMAEKRPGLYQRVAESPQVDTAAYDFLMEQAKVRNPDLYERLSGKKKEFYYDRIAEEVTAWIIDHRQKAIGYLKGEGSLEKLFSQARDWWNEHSHSVHEAHDALHRLKGKPDCLEMYEKGVILMALGGRSRFFNYSFLPRCGSFQDMEPKDREEILSQTSREVADLAGIFERRGLPLYYQVEVFAAIIEETYDRNLAQCKREAAVEAVARQAAAHKEGIRKLVQTASAPGKYFMNYPGATAPGKCFSIHVLDRLIREQSGQEEKELLFAGTSDRSRQVRESAEAVLAGHREWEPEILAMLESKKMQTRETGIHILQNWGAENYKEVLAQALEKEKSKKLKELLASCLCVEADRDSESRGLTPASLVEQLLKGGRARKVAWAYETPFPKVHDREGREAEEKYLKALFVAYADQAVPGVSREAARLAEDLHPGELAAAAADLFGKWMDLGAEAKKKWVLYTYAIHGGEEAVSVLTRKIQDWAQKSRGALAAEAVRAMAFNGGAQALLQVDQIARKFKFRQVKAAAAAALEAAASALGISRAQLEDRIVPNLGFDESFCRIFDYGSRSFRVSLTPALELEVFEDGGKRLKNLPAPGKKDEEEKAAAAYQEFKQLKKQLKTVTANQKLRLEQALFVERLWTAEEWKSLFVNNPVMHQFAIGLVWGIYEEGSLKETFRYMEDGSFNTREEEETEVMGSIGLVHPIELSEEELAGWKEQLEDYEIIQPIEQLNRPVYRVTEEEKQKKELTRFGGMVLNGLSLSGKLLGMGWYRGSIEDAGCYFGFYHELETLAAEIEFSGCGVGYENEEITVYGLSFWGGKISTRGYLDEKALEAGRLPLGEVTPRYFSEILLQLHRATVSSQEQLDYPACREYQ